MYIWAFHPIFVTSFLDVFADEVTKIFVYFFYCVRLAGPKFKVMKITKLKWQKNPENLVTKICNEQGKSKQNCHSPDVMFQKKKIIRKFDLWIWTIHFSEIFLIFISLQALNLQIAVTNGMVMILLHIHWKITGIKEVQPTINFSGRKLPVQTKRYLVIFLPKYNSN